MDIIEKLIDVLKENFYDEYEFEEIAENMIANGITVQELGGCDFCQKFDFAGARAEVNKYGAHICLATCNTKFSNDEQFKFCPVCGLKLAKQPKGD